MKSLEVLDMQHNALADVDAVTPIGVLPVLHTLLLLGNPVTAVVEYRTRVLQAFGERAAEVKWIKLTKRQPNSQVRLDDRRANSREMDIIHVRIAINAAKRERQEMEARRRQQALEQLSMLNAVDKQSPISGDEVPLTSEPSTSY